MKDDQTNRKNGKFTKNDIKISNLKIVEFDWFSRKYKPQWDLTLHPQEWFKKRLKYQVLTNS